MQEQESLWSRGLQERPSEVTEGEGSVGESGWLQIQASEWLSGPTVSGR